MSTTNRKETTLRMLLRTDHEAMACRIVARITRAIAAGAIVFGSAFAAAEELPDLREFHVGMSAADLPPTGYADFTCAEDTTPSLQDWSSWRVCTPDADGKRAIRFKYDESSSPGGTKVGGHPVLLTLVISDDAHVTGLIIETDPHAKPFQRKKAFLLGLQARAHYGADGWSCTENPPTGDEAPIGTTFIKEDCTKELAARKITVRRQLYRNAKADSNAYVSATNIMIETIN
jgi:hypothetical protein